MNASQPLDRPEPIAMKLPDASAYCGLKRSKLYELMAEGRLESVKIGKSRLIKTASLRRLIEEAA